MYTIKYKVIFLVERKTGRIALELNVFQDQILDHMTKREKNRYYQIEAERTDHYTEEPTIYRHFHYIDKVTYNIPIIEEKDKAQILAVTVG